MFVGRGAGGARAGALIRLRARSLPHHTGIRIQTKTKFSDNSGCGRGKDKGEKGREMEGKRTRVSNKRSGDDRLVLDRVQGTRRIYDASLFFEHLHRTLEYAEL